MAEVDVDLIEDITGRAVHMRLGLAKYPVDEIKALCAEFRRLRAAEMIRSRTAAINPLTELQLARKE